MASTRHAIVYLWGLHFADRGRAIASHLSDDAVDVLEPLSPDLLEAVLVRAGPDADAVVAAARRVTEHFLRVGTIRLEDVNTLVGASPSGDLVLEPNWGRDEGVALWVELGDASSPGRDRRPGSWMWRGELGEYLGEVAFLPDELANQGDVDEWE